VRKVPLHFALNDCGRLVLPDVEMLFEIKSYVLLSGEVQYDSIWVDSSPKCSAKSAKLYVVGKYNELLVLN
jgi:hypothetical protein